MSDHREARRGRRSAGDLRGWGLTSAAVTAGIAVMVLVSTSAVGATVSPPFTGKTVKFVYDEIGGCAGGSYGHRASWSLSTGSYLWAASAGAKTCAPPLPHDLGGFAYQVGQFYSFIPLTISAGVHSVAANWTAKYSTAGSITWTGSCPGLTTRTSTYNYTTGECLIESYAQVQVYSAIYDATNQSVLTSNTGNMGYTVSAYNQTDNLTYIYWSCTHGASSCTSMNISVGDPANSSWSLSDSTASTAWINGTFVRGHHYYLEVSILSQTGTLTFGWLRSTARASVNAGTGGNGIDLRSIYIH